MITAERDSLFSIDYATARDRFLGAARASGATLHELALQARGPAGEALSIDIARLGERGARRVLLHTSGIHGVEAFAGSAIQLAGTVPVARRVASARKPTMNHGTSIVSDGA